MHSKKSRWQEEKEEREYLRLERYCIQNEETVKLKTLQVDKSEIDNLFKVKKTLKQAIERVS